jgi:hypothetical protein
MDLYNEKRVVFAYLVYKKYIAKKYTRYWVHPYTEMRLLRGTFSTSFGDMRENLGKVFFFFLFLLFPREPEGFAVNT